MTQEPLFPLPRREPLVKAKTLREVAREQSPQWTRYRPKNRVPCDECIFVLVEADGKGPLPRGARWKRRTPERVLVLCNEHADHWKAEDAK